MHDGRFANLDQVIDHYNRGIQPHPHLDKNLMVTGGSAPVRLNLTQEEKDALVAFLRTLTDVSFITDKKFSDPFAKISRFTVIYVVINKPCGTKNGNAGSNEVKGAKPFQELP